MIKEFIENPIVRENVRRAFNINAKGMLQGLMADNNLKSISSGINVADDEKSLYVTINLGNIIYYSYIRENNHRITLEHGIKYKSGYIYKTRKPSDYYEYLTCHEISLHALESLYEVISLGDLKRND